jgi:hypothetical protein
VTSDAVRIVVDGALPTDRGLDGLADWTFTGATFGVFPRTVLGALLVVEVKSVPSASPSLTLDRDAVPLSLEVTRVPLSTLRLPPSISFLIASTFFRRMLLLLAVFLRSAAVVAVNGGLGGARAGGGVGGSRVGGAGGCVLSLCLCWSCSSPRSVGSGV